MPVLTVDRAGRYEEVINRSRFIGSVCPCAGEEACRRHLLALHQEYPDATHIAWGYRILTDRGVAARFHDAAEPSGTAGKPILQLLDASDLVNLLVAVVRYFGGVKLGAGGLTRAYGNTAKKALDQVPIVPYVEMAELRLRLGYAQLPRLEYRLPVFGGRILEQDFGAGVEVLLSLPKAQVEELLREFGGD